MYHKKKYKVLSLLLTGIIISTVLFNGLKEETVNVNSQKIGNAKIKSIKSSKAIKPEQQAFTPVALVLACPETPAAAGALVLATAWLLGNNHQQNKSNNQYFAKTEYQDYRLSKLD